MTYQPGQRVALVHTDDPHTALRPGDQGTVRRYHPDLQTVDVDWDNGSHLSMCLDAGDRIQILDEPPTRAGDRAAPADELWHRVLDAMRAAGAGAGRDAAGWWGQDTVGGRASGDVTATARRILAGIDDGDPAVLDTLPTLDLSGRPADAPSDADRYRDAAPDGAPTWSELTARQRDEALDAYRDGFDTAVTDRVAELCRIAASPTGDGRDLGHLHPDRVRIGSVGVFSGDWAWTPAPDGAMRIPVGYVGTLADVWNGWAVFSCTRQVAEAIVADQQHCREQYRQHLHAQGVTGRELDRQVNASMASLVFDGDTIVADQRGVCDDPEAIEQIGPDADGRYVVMGRSWCWEAVDPADCDRIVGELPAPGEQQQWVLLTHVAGMRVPHDRLKVASVHYEPADLDSFTAVVEFDGKPVATIEHDGDSGAIVLRSPKSPSGCEDVRRYVAGCRYRGEPVGEQRVLRALVDQYEAECAVADAHAVGDMLARLLDNDGLTLILHRVQRARLGWDDLARLGRRLAATHPHPRGHEWQIWTGTSWSTLPHTSPTA
jgi:hypothetical protein